MAQKAKEHKIISIEYAGEKHTARWNTGAFRSFLTLFKNVNADVTQTSQVKESIEIAEAANEVLTGMLIRSGMTRETIEDIDADVFAEQSGLVLRWAIEGMNQMSAVRDGNASKKE